MKTKVVSCSKCKECAVHIGVGFLTNEKLHCTKFDIPVEESDGCSFGENGTPKRGTTAPEVSLDNSYVAVWGLR